MYIIFLMIAVSVTVAAAFLGAFLWAVRSGQYDDDYTPAVRMLFDNETTPPKSKPAADKEAK
ncbi:cbb3-type cytochrome oxidase assembly protein CcoS [Pontibacter sp. Tf4]|uniref:cbb3-type cytochrome oxidase assembly protein CcoS n=1 Tax=Pontibacter sp. Tf4 TaxID=2761620 RepID=UPI0016279763|nr:cbb3-type cytochrome oxidase assembly protein CcoS [Pontibacter sp. Tf4]MBB6610362.1 cbb3-type cytochrome oxidase assembly protein CcoS [Pontibacter sp. Tf4]